MLECLAVVKYTKDAKTALMFKLKVVCSHCILIPQAQPEVVLFLVTNESPYFSHYNPKIPGSNLITLRQF